MFEHSLKIDDLDQLYVPAAAAEFSPIRKLALGVLAHAIREAESDQQGHSPRGHKSGCQIAGIADNALEWLNRWHLVEPWCLIAEIAPSRLRRRISQLGQQERLAA